MWQTIIIWVIIFLCAFFVGRRYWRQWRIALKADQDVGCIQSGCSCCSSVSTCSTVKKAKSSK
ncbi:MAG: FeoB-associated Cys-rich membrane protein [Desulfobacterales bacterium]|nr:FeoB-associated Cys-rich membrane protein [Deltaproteobacteria bacterium]MBT8360907.1 FeoB-associated Cys-rich membrane protein [Deltaproteobacteria bacterium]NNK93133.1 FeoB-associated Cys-rich membrane protein [Desulfobacterales bacterium]